MLRLLLRTLLVLSCSWASGCQSRPTSEVVPTEELDIAVVGEWRVESVAEQPSPESSDAFLGFSADGRFYGSTGCNRMMGQWELAGERLQLGPVATTRMAGPPELMEQELRILRILGNEPVLGIVGDELHLTGALGETGTQLLGRRQATTE